MKIYLASVAPGTEGGTTGLSLSCPRRLLSYWQILKNEFGAKGLFLTIKENHDAKRKPT
jgi:hypothetical protein